MIAKAAAVLMWLTLAVLTVTQSRSLANQGRHWRAAAAPGAISIGGMVAFVATQSAFSLGVAIVAGVAAVITSTKSMRSKEAP